MLARPRFHCLIALLAASLIGCSASDLSGGGAEDIGATFGAEDSSGGGGADAAVPVPTFHLTVNTGFSDDSPIAGQPMNKKAVDANRTFKAGDD